MARAAGLVLGVAMISIRLRILKEERMMSRTIDAVGNILDVVLMFRNSSAKYSTQQIASKLKVSDDTARRYLLRISASGLVPLIKDGKYWICIKEEQGE